MAVIVNCPLCLVPIGSVNKKGLFQGVCPSCQFHYGVAYGSLSSCSSRRVILKRETAKHAGVYERQYELRITTPARKLAIFKFSTPGQEEQLLAQSGDRILIAFTLKNDSLEELISIDNQTTGETYSLSTPGNKARKTAKSVGFVTFVSVLIALLVAFGTANAWLIFIPIGLGITAFFVARNQLAPKATLTKFEKMRLLSEQKILLQKQKLQQRIYQLNEEYETNLDLIENLQSLKQKMVEVGESLYVSRIENINGAIKIVRKQIHNDRRLVEKYEKIIKILEIEYETSTTTAQLPEDINSKFLSRLTELKAIEKSNQELRIQLEANEEVRRLKT